MIHQHQSNQKRAIAMAYKKRTTHKTHKAKIEEIASRMVAAGWREIQEITGLSYYAARNQRGEIITAYRCLLVRTMSSLGIDGNVIVRQSGMSSRTVWKYLTGDEWMMLPFDDRMRVMDAMTKENQ